MNLRNPILSLAVIFLSVNMASALTIDMVPVGDAGNDPDTRHNSISVGSVSSLYYIGKYEITAGQYTAFLNTVAKTDTYHLYNSSMLSITYGCKIRQSGSDGNYSYLVDANGDGMEDNDMLNRPVNFVSWGDAARFCNWLHNDQPTGTQDLSTTEDGSYFLNGATSVADLMAATRKPDATWVIPSEDEWYKAAYYKGGGTNAGYWDYPTRTDTVPNNGNPEGDTGNTANFTDSDRGPYYTTPVGYFGKSASTYGTFDQGGNVWEWNETVVAISSRGVRGGAWGNDYTTLAASNRIIYPMIESYGIGFRVAFVPEPGSIIMLAGIAVMSLLFKWRRNA